MPKLVWLDQGKVKETIVPDRGFITVGRGSDNTVCLADAQVSRYHARLVCGPHGCLLKDLRNGEAVQVNGEAVLSRFLQDGDIIRIGHHVLEYLLEAPASGARHSAAELSGATFQVRAGQPRPGNWSDPQRKAFLRYLDGPNVGRIVNIDRPLVPVGNPDDYYAAISRRTNGYYLLNLGKGLYARLNDNAVRGSAGALNNGDVITLGNERIEVRIFEQGAQGRGDPR